MPAPPGLLSAAPKFSESPCVAAGEGHKAAKKRVRQEKIAGVSKVIGISKLRTKYEPFEAKRTLCNSFDLFVADDRIIPSLPKLLGQAQTLCSVFAPSCGRLCLCGVLVPSAAAAVPGPCPACCHGALAVKFATAVQCRAVDPAHMHAAPAGKHFFKKKKSPIPVDLTSKDWAAQIGKAVSGTYLRKGLGSTLSIRCQLQGPCNSMTVALALKLACFALLAMCNRKTGVALATDKLMPAEFKVAATEADRNL